MSNLREQINEASERFAKRTCGICTFLGLAVPLSMGFMGGLHLDQCPAQRFIPVYLLVAGVVGILMTVIRMVRNCCEKEDRATPLPLRIFSGLVTLFISAWFIAGNVWIYGIHSKYSTISTDNNYCNNTLYLFAFWVTTATYILLGAVIFIACIMFVISLFSSDS